MILLSLLSALAADVPDQYRASYDAEASADYARALSALDAMPGSEKKTYVYTVRRAWLLYLKGEYDASIEAYRTARKVEPEAVEPRLGELLPLLAARRFLDAESLASAILKDRPHDTVARSRRAWARYNLGRYADAEADYRAVLEDWPADADMLAGLGWCRLKQGDAAGARTHFEAVLRFDPRDDSARAGLDAL